MPFDAVQVTVVVPFANAEPEAGTHTTVGTGKPVAVGVNVVTAVHKFGSVDFVMFAGQVIAGGSVTVIGAVTVVLSTVASAPPRPPVAPEVNVEVAVAELCIVVSEPDSVPFTALLNTIGRPISTSRLLAAIVVLSDLIRKLAVRVLVHPPLRIVEGFAV